MDLNLSGFIIVLFLENQFIALFFSNVRILISLTKIFANDYKVLSPAKLCTKACSMQKYKSFRNALNRKELTMEPRGNPEHL